MNEVTVQTTQKREILRWITLKGSVALILFIVIAAIVEYAIVVYARSLGAPDDTVFCGFKFPGTEYNLGINVSPLFHLVPIAVIIALASSWIYLTKHAIVRPYDVQKAKAGKRGKEQRMGISDKIKLRLYRMRGFSHIQSALTVFLLFLLFILAISLLVYPRLIYEALSNAYQNNPGLLSFIKDTGNALSSIGSVFSGVSNALLSGSAGFRDFAVGLGNVISPLSSLDNAAKYLIFQNAAVWICALIVLYYGEFGRKSHQYKKK